MADKADNENQGMPASGERRAALRSEVSSGGSTRLRESGFPMRKASKLPDVSAYSSLDEANSSRAASTGREADETAPVERVESQDTEAGSDKDPETAVRPESHGVSSVPAAPATSDTPAASDPTETASSNSGGRRDDEHLGGERQADEPQPRGDDAEDRITADSSTPATQQIAATPVSATQAGPASADSTPAGSASTGSTPAGSASAGSASGGSTPAGSTPAGSASTGSTPAGPASGGSTPANPASAESPPAGSASADSTPADSTPAGSTPAGSAAGGSTRAASTAARPTDLRSSRSRTDDDANPDTSALTIRPPEEDVNRRANQRDEAAAAKPLLPRILQVAVAVFFPIILLAAAVRAVTTPLFLWIEYHRPGFPADSYGFSTEDRMTYGSYAMDYILNWAPARYLGDLVNTDGDQLFLDSEVGHMADVKGVLSTGFVVATILAILAFAACIYLARRYPGGVRRALFAGAVATLVLAIALAVAGILAWEKFFTQVHALFFADGTWTFRLDDTLIRLFPTQFWIDAAASVGAIVVIGAALTLVLTWPTKVRREKSARAYAARRANSGI